MNEYIMLYLSKVCVIERYTAKKSVWAKRCETTLLHATRIPNIEI